MFDNKINTSGDDDTDGVTVVGSIDKHIAEKSKWRIDSIIFA